MKVFASDYDGTLYKNQVITDYDLRQIRKLRAAGHKFGIVTGRTINSIVFEINKHNIPVDFIVGINGGVVLRNDFKELFSSRMDVSVIPELMTTLHHLDVLYYGVNDGYRMGRVHVTKEDDETEFNIELTPVEELMQSGVRALYVRCRDREHAKKVADTINELYYEEGVKAYPNNWSVDIGVRGVSKASGLYHILEELRVDDFKDVFTIGDAYNDVSMLTKFNGFLMDNAHDDLKSNMNSQTIVIETVGDAIEKICEED